MLSEPVVVAQSAGGLLLPAIATAVGATHAVWLAALVPDVGRGRAAAEEIQADKDTMFGPEWPSWTSALAGAPADTAYFLFHDCDLETLRWGLATLRYFNLGAVYRETPTRHELPPSTYVLPRQDRTLTPRWMRKAAQERLGVEPTEVDGGYCPHASRPDQIAALLDR